MNKFLLAAFGVAAVVAPMTAATSKGDEVSAPVAKPVMAQQIAWGDTAGELQLGVRFAAKPQIYRRGETIRFDLVARNVGKKAVKFEYYSPLFPVPAVTDENGKTLTRVLKSPPPTNLPLRKFAITLSSGAQKEIEQTELRFGAPLEQTLFWALDAAPGKYRVSFSARFQLPSQQKNNSLSLKSGFAPIEIGPDVIAEEGAEFAAQLPPGAILKPKPYNWGREVNGLQLGIRLEVPGEPIPATKPVPLGTIVAFAMAVRNIGENPIEIQYSEAMWSQSPSVTDEAGQQLSSNAQAALIGAARGGQAFTVTKILAPQEMLEFDNEFLAVGMPEGDFSDPVLAVEPGVYRVSYRYIFDPANALASRVHGLKNLVQFERDKLERTEPDYKYNLTSGEVWLEVAPAKLDKL